MNLGVPPASSEVFADGETKKRVTLAEYLSSSSVIALNHAIEERVRNCLFASEKTGKAYFDELLSILSHIPAGKDFSYKIQAREKTLSPVISSLEKMIFYFPEETLSRMQREVLTLNIFEKKFLLSQIQRIAGQKNPLSAHLIGAYNFLIITLQQALQKSTKKSFARIPLAYELRVRSLDAGDIEDIQIQEPYYGNVIFLSEVIERRRKEKSETLIGNQEE